MTATHIPTAVIFDLYGTLVEITRPSRIYETLARRSEIVLQEAFDIALKNDIPSLANYASRIGLLELEDIEKLESELASEVQTVKLFDDVVPTLTRLKQRGVKTAIISNLATPYIQPFRDLGLDELVDVAVFSCECGFKKPQIEIYQLAIGEIRCDANDAVMVGDSIKCDVDGPSRIGIKGIQLARAREVAAFVTAVGSLTEFLELYE